MKKLVALITAILIAGVAGAFAQTPLKVIGSITPGDCAQFNSPTIVKDAGFNCNGSPAVVFANPTGAVGLSAVNGSATSAMRSDAAPALSSSVQTSLTATLNQLLIGTGAVGFAPTTTGTGVLTALGIAVNASGGIPSPTTVRAGDVIYWNGSNYVILAGNNSGTNCLQENSSGVPSWAACSTANALTVGTTTVVSGTSNGVIFNNAGVVGNTSAGTAGQALVSNGSGSAPTFQTGQWVLLNTLTASNSATLTDTTSISATYTEYEIVLEQILPATNAVTLHFQFQVGGTFQSASYLASELAGGGSGTGSSSDTTGVLVGAATSVLNTAPGVNGRYLLSNPAQTLTCKMMLGDWSYISTSAFTGTSAGCYNGGSGAITGIQLLASTGNLTSGKMKIYGRVN